MIAKIVKVVGVAIGMFATWFLYWMAHPSPKEPRFIYKLRRHPSAIPEYIALLSYGLFHPRFLQTGATNLEKKREFPGDSLVPHPKFQETRATTINVPIDQLWPWIVQMGAGRGGYYWWTPCEAFPEYAQYVIKTDEILPQFQQLNVGDRLSDGGPYSTEERGNWEVKSIEPGRSLVLYAARQVTEGNDFDRDQRKPKGLWFICSWAFLLEPLEAEKTRLLVRVRSIGGPAWLFGGMRLILKGDTVAHRSMFERLKAKSETFYRQRSSLPSPAS